LKVIFYVIYKIEVVMTAGRMVRIVFASISFNGFRLRLRLKLYILSQLPFNLFILSLLCI